MEAVDDLCADLADLDCCAMHFAVLSAAGSVSIFMRIASALIHEIIIQGA